MPHARLNSLQVLAPALLATLYVFLVFSAFSEAPTRLPGQDVLTVRDRNPLLGSEACVRIGAAVCAAAGLQR